MALNKRERRSYRAMLKRLFQEVDSLDFTAIQQEMMRHEAKRAIRAFVARMPYMGNTMG